MVGRGNRVVGKGNRVVGKGYLRVRVTLSFISLTLTLIKERNQQIYILSFTKPNYFNAALIKLNGSKSKVLTPLKILQRTYGC